MEFCGDSNEHVELNSGSLPGGCGVIFLASLESGLVVFKEKD
jgi:hypothetical protein